MSSESPGQPRRASLEVLRAEAQDELATVVVERLRAGEDPWAFMDEIPSVDELVVHFGVNKSPVTSQVKEIFGEKVYSFKATRTN